MKIKKLLLVALLFESCRSIPIYKYEVEDLKNKTNLSNKTLKILFLKDERKGENVNKSILSLVPLFISGTTELNFPEYDEISVNTPLEFFIADILEKEISSSYNFKKITITNDESLPTDYTIHGVLNKSYCERNIYTYGLSIYGVLLWYFGAPAMSNECEIDLKIFFNDSKNKQLFSKTYSKKQSLNVGFYTKFSNLNRIYGEIFKNISKEIMNDFSSNISN
ncbi:hypothetical protein [Leptospira mtsangambouensis]|uniref:hypothetical protein n=1 Tax=Leptospira mtsangambouensis TaxID=2484912 RepID=UPI001EEADA1A|nr:hypothetical protein [Leptospira mtsangambouensis]MCG6142762.1 hypothetical protein [Leptospira mtsangambouensis]